MNLIKGKICRYFADEIMDYIKSNVDIHGIKRNSSGVGSESIYISFIYLTGYFTIRISCHYKCERDTNNYIFDFNPYYDNPFEFLKYLIKIKKKHINHAIKNNTSNRQRAADNRPLHR